MHRDYIQLFACNGIVANFTYTPIKVWEIRLPHLILTIENHRKNTDTRFAEEIKTFAPRGYEVYAKIFEKLAQLSVESEYPALPTFIKTLRSDQCAFGEIVETVNKMALDENADLFELTDAMFKVKKTLADSVEYWIHRFTECSSKPSILSTNISRHDIQDTSPSDSKTISSDQLPSVSEGNADSSASVSDQESRVPFGENALLALKSPPQDNVTHSGPSTGDKEQKPPSGNTDKKKIKAIFRAVPSDKSLLNLLQSPIPSTDHFCLPMGQIPILVSDNDLSSIIAYTIVSHEYKKSLTSIEERASKKSYDSHSETDDKDNEKERKTKTPLYTDIIFQDSTTQFTCRIYFAREFHAMRSSFLKSRTNGGFYCSNDEDKTKNLEDLLHFLFARSLSKSVRWEARGGKSGSKFSKTLGRSLDLNCANSKLTYRAKRA